MLDPACAIDDFRERPIPLRAGDAASAHDYHDVPIDLSCELAGEPLEDASSYGLACASYYAREDGLNAPFYKRFASASEQVYLRRSVLKRLVSVNSSLRPYKVELLLLDGYRPIELQREVWCDFVDQARRVLANPTEEECARYAGYYCSDPRSFDKNDFRTWPVHTTGGAIDICIRSIVRGEPLYFGSVFDDATEVSYTDYFERLESEGRPGASIVEARRNRRLLYWAMMEAGFANYPYEWWHYDWGTQMWVVNGGGTGAAVYGYVERL
jgi:D-alanyl-D-alanine dipeptidase